MRKAHGASAVAESATPTRLGSTAGVTALCILAVAGLFVAFELRDIGQIFEKLALAQAQVRAFLTHLSILGPLGFIAAYGALMLLIWVPSWPLSVIGGFLFGPIAGTIYSLIGSTLGAIGVFALAKAGLTHRIPRDSAIMRTLDAGFRHDALEYVIVLRIMPVMPFGIIHVAAAIFGVSLRVFTFGTVIGMIPCILIYAFLGADLDHILAGGRALSAATLLQSNVLLPLTALAALALIPIAIKRFRNRRPQL